MVLLVGSTPRTLENLPPRPPTPPRESSQVPPRSSFLGFLSSKLLGTQTPPSNSPDSSAELPEASSDRSLKRVEWASNTDYQDPPTSSGKSSAAGGETIRPITPSGSQKPTKSILKPYNGVNAVNRLQPPSKFAPPHTYPSFAMMMESIVKQLAGEDRSSRLDAYMTLSGVLKASETIPDPKALKDKMGLLTQFIQRDMKAKTLSGNSDTPLINNALILLATFLFKNSMSEGFSSDFCVYVLEHSANAFEDPQVSKDVVKHLMFIVGQQNFSSKVMTTERAGRLIKSLHEIESHVKGKSIILGRLGIYRKLLKQARAAMLINTTWIEDLISDMLSSLEEIRAPVINFGLEAALNLGAEKQASRTVMDLFQLEQEDGKYADHYARQLVAMVKKKQSASSVPRIWSTIVLFLRCHQSQLEQWEFMKLWLQTIQTCFNDSDHEVKVQANLAWNRLVFAIRLSERTTSAMVKTLWQPFGGQLTRKQASKHSKEARQVTIESICNLLYYAMRPQATFSQIDLYWDEYVQVLIATLLSTGDKAKGKAKEDLPQACEILSALLDGSVAHTSKQWNPNRANEAGGVKAEELPSLDPRWIRKNSQRVLDVLEPLLKKCFWDVGGADASILSVWKGFISSVASAGSKEIKVSNETMVCVARMFTMLYNIWQNGPKTSELADLEGSAKFQASFTTLVTTAINGLGILAFTEKLLSISKQDTFTVISTPSNRLTQPAGNVRSPIHHLVILLSRPHSEIKCDENFVRMVKAIISPFLVGPKPLWSRMEFAKDLVQLLLPGTESRASCAVWQVIADFTTVAIEQREETSSNSGSGSHGQPLGADFRNVVRILDAGIVLSPDMPLNGWITLFNTIGAHITTEVGDSGRAISLVEPLSKVLLSLSSEAEQKPGVSYSCVLLGSAGFPKDRQAMDSAQRRLWGSVAAGQPSSTFDPYVKFYVFLTMSLQDAYNTLSIGHSVAHSDLLSHFLAFVRNCPSANMLNLLSHVQEGLATWIIDSDNNLESRGASDTAISVSALWGEVCRAITNTQTNSALLRTLEVLICSGLESKHKSIVNKSITLWNSTFGVESKLDYPERVRNALLRLRPYADLELPSLPSSLQYEGNMPVPSFLDSQQNDLPIPDGITTPLKVQEQVPRLEPSALPRNTHHSYPQVIIELSKPASRKRPLEDEHKSSTRISAKRQLTPKLRHDDSQIQFAAIESSPLADAVLDSQLLTDRQREVKDRQQNENAILFPDLRSSPRARAKATRSSLEQSSAVKLTDPTNEQPGTPAVELPNKSFDYFVTSSPTPRRNIPAAQVDSDPVDYPSSPPEQKSEVHAEDAELPVIADGMSVEFMKFWDVSSSSPRSPIPQSLLNKLSNPNTFTGGTENDSREAIGENFAELAKSPHVQAVDRLATPISSPRSTSNEPRSARTSNENYVDAMSSPLRQTSEGNEKSENFLDALSSPHGGFELKEILEPLKPGEHVTSSSGRLHDSFPPGALSSLPDLDEESMIRLLNEAEHLQGKAASNTSDIPSAQPAYPILVAIESMTSTANGVVATGENNIQVSDPDAEVSSCIVVQGYLRRVVAPNMTLDSPGKSSLGKPIKKPISTRAKGTTSAVVLSTIPETPGPGNSRSSAKGAGKRTRTSARLQEVGDSEVSRKTKLTNKRQKQKSDSDLPDRQEEKQVEETRQSSADAPLLGSSVSPPKKSNDSRPTRKVYGTRGRPLKSIILEVEAPKAVQDSSMDLGLPTTIPHSPKDEIEQDRIEEVTTFDELTSPIAESLGKHAVVTVPVQISNEGFGGLISSTGTENDFTEKVTNQNLLIQPNIAEVQVAAPLSSVVVAPEVTSTEVAMMEPDAKVSSETIAEPSVMERFDGFFAALQSATLTRAEAKKIKDMLWDVEGEIFAAEKRGRALQ